MPIRAKEKEMAGRKMAGFTRGGSPVDPSRVHAHPKQKKKGTGAGKSFDGGQIAAIAGAGIATGIVGALTVGALREGFGGGGGGGRFGNKGR